MSKEEENKAKKLSPANAEAQRQLRLQLFRAGFMSGMGYRGCPKYNAKDDDCFAKAMEACDKMFAVMDDEPSFPAASEFQSIARILGLADEK